MNDLQKGEESLDPLEVIENVPQVVPQFQPVLNSSEYRIIGYEVLGRINQDGALNSLGPFFRDLSVPSEYKWEVDKELYRQAVKRVLEGKLLSRLFFNVDPNTLVQLHCLEELMELFEEFCKEGLHRKQVVFEMRLTDYQGDLNDLSHMIMYMKASGYSVALDDIKTNDANLDQLSKLEPNIIKVELSDLKSSVNVHTYRDVLSALSIFARKIGAGLHFKGIQDAHQLHIAWKHGGRFLQGFYLHEPVNEFIDEYTIHPFLQKSIHSFIDMAHRKLQNQIDFICWMDAKMEEKSHDVFTDQLVENIAKETHDASFRVYVCDVYGYQKSPNWIKNEDKQWTPDETTRGKNWSWRTYFLAHIMQMKYRKSGVLSDKYRDIETNDLIRTYSYPLGEEHYIFIDLDPVFLFENDWLL
jgi:EAL domain-containing protein (putative c-di-GMP-specific phosphodiesterase class I)